MIHSLSGVVSSKRDNFITLDVHGVGFKILISGSSLSDIGPVGSSASILTHLHVREDELSLFGFLTHDELDLFESLISVSGIGPKSAMNVLSIANIERITAAIAGGEIELLQKVSGIGRKTAERIILELRDKMQISGTSDTIKSMEKDDDVYEALIGLGYSAKQAKNALSKVEKGIDNTSERLKEALKVIKS